jgi:pimeloyl-ACP methyl ester carboxylesterase
MSPFENSIRLRDGRTLGIMECGDPGGMPVLYFHGFPGSRLEVQLAERSAARLNVRLIGIDRPGYGISDFKPDRNLIDWPDDVVELADHFGLDRFKVMGISGGGPYAAACAHKILHRLTAVGIGCGLGPIDPAGMLAEMTWVNRFGLKFAGKIPALTKLMFLPLAYFLRHHPEKVLTSMAQLATEPDRSVMQSTQVKQIMAASFRESMHRGPAGAIHDLMLYAKPWGFDLQDIRTRVYLWHGEKDVIVPSAMARHLAAAIPDCRSVFFPEEGHFSLVVHQMDKFFRTLAT